MQIYILDTSTECDCQPLVLVSSCQGGHPVALHTLGLLIFALEIQGYITLPEPLTKNLPYIFVAKKKLRYADHIQRKYP